MFSNGVDKNLICCTLYRDMAKQSALFAITFVALFALSFLFLAWVDVLPEPIDPASALSQPGGTTPLAGQYAELPVRIVAPAIGMDNNVLNPESSDIAALDAALLKGAVRSPDSSLLGAEGTVLIFGHSSYLPIVRNQNYKVFNNIKKLKEGDIVSVMSDTAEYRYKVKSVTTDTADADQVLWVELPKEGSNLMLVTCDSFGKKSNRFIVTAEFQGVYRL